MAGLNLPYWNAVLPDGRTMQEHVRDELRAWAKANSDKELKIQINGVREG